MKIKEYNQMMSYLTRPSDKMKGKFVKVRKPNAVPPKTKTIQKFNKGGKAEPYGKVKIMVDPTSDLGYSGLTVEDDMKLKGIVYDSAIGMFVDKRTGERGSLSDFVTANQFDSKNEEDKYFEPILDKLKNKKVAKKPKPPKPPAEPKPNGLDPNPTVIPFPMPPDAPLNEWWKTEIEPKKPDLTLDEYMDIKKRERVFMSGIGRLFSKKNS